MRVLLLQIGHVKLAFVDRALVQVPLNVLRRPVLLPVVQLETLLHLVVLVFVPQEEVCGLDSADDPQC